MVTVPTSNAIGDKLSQRIQARALGLSKALVRVLTYIDANRLDALTLSGVELAAAIGTSDATVIRAVQALGYDGLKELKRELATTFGKGQTAADNMARTFTGIGDTRDNAIDQVIEDHAASFATLSSDKTRAQMQAAVKVLAAARRIGVFGIGPSAYLARYFGLQVSRSGRPTFVFDGSDRPLPDQLLAMKDVDAVVLLAYGRPYKEATACIAEARRLRKRIILITDTGEKGLASLVSLVVEVHRGQAGRIALHGATFVCLEAMALALSASHRERAITTLERLNELRKSVGKAPQ